MNHCVDKPNDDNIETYSTRPSKGNNGIFYYTSICGNRMFRYTYEPMKYHNSICPKCGRTLIFDREES